MRNTFLLLPALLLASCGPNFPNTDAWGVGNLRLDVWVNTTQAQVGTTIQIRYRVTNTGDEPEIIELADRPVMDISIRFESQVTHEHIVIRWSDGREVTDDLRRLVWEPGETKTLEMTWIVDEQARDGIVHAGGLLRFGEREGEASGTSVAICVRMCLPG